MRYEEVATSLNLSTHKNDTTIYHEECDSSPSLRAGVVSILMSKMVVAIPILVKLDGGHSHFYRKQNWVLVPLSISLHTYANNMTMQEGHAH